MRLNRIKRTGSILIVVMIAYYALGALWFLRHRNDPKRQQPTDYYGQAVSAVPTQWGRRSSSTVCGPGGCVATTMTSNAADGQEVWTTYSDAWVYRHGNVEQGRIYRDGRVEGFANSQPSFYPSDMPRAFQQAVAQQRTTSPIGELPPPGSPSAGQTLPPTGVDQSKLATDKARIPGGVSVNGVPETEALVRQKLSDSAKSQGLKDYENSLRLVVVGHNTERQPFVAVAKSTADQSNERLIIQEYEDDDWQIKAHAHAAKSLPEYQAGKPFAYLQRSTGAVKAIMYTPGEVERVIKQARPEIAPNFDAAKARALTQANNDWLLWASGAFVAMCGLFGAITTKQPQ